MAIFHCYVSSPEGIIFLGLFLRAEFQGIYCQYMAKNMVQYLHFRILEFPLKTWLAPKWTSASWEECWSTAFSHVIWCWYLHVHVGTITIYIYIYIYIYVMYIYIHIYIYTYIYIYIYIYINSNLSLLTCWPYGPWREPWKELRKNSWK